MSDDDEMEDFSVNDEDYKRAMNSNYRRKGSKMSREENMLGIFATNDDSDEEANDADEELLASFSYKNKRTKNIDFVSQNTKVQNKKIVKKKESEFTIVDTYVSSDEDSNPDDEKQPEAEEVIQVDIDKFAKPKQVLTGPTFAEKKKPVPKKNSSLNRSEQKEVGNWEKYEKGFGSKMLLKMGWEKGKGLGKELHGRAIPVEATLRKGKGAVGKYGPESKDIGREKAESDSEDEAPSHVSQWKNKSQNKKKLEYSTIRTTEELLSMASNNKKKLKRAEQMLENKPSDSASFPLAPVSKMKIIDMTGKQQSVYHGYDNISMISSAGLKEKDKVNFDLPELVKNLDILVNMTEEKIIHSEKKLKHYDDMVINLSYDKTRSLERIEQEKIEIDRIEDILLSIQKCEQLIESQSELKDIINTFVQLKKDYADEFLIFNLSQLALPLFTPSLKDKMSRWRPFYNKDFEKDETTNILYCHEIYSNIKSLFNNSSQSINPFHRLIWDTWMFSFRKLIAQENIRESGQRCVDILNSWSTLIPKYILENILEQFILTKLVYEIEIWNPLVDVVPVHKWIHPWLPLMKDRLDTEIFPTIRFKLANALTNWHPSDISAKAILVPWKPPAFSSTCWDTFMCKNIIPKLEIVLSEDLIINPGDQDLNPWKWVMSWLDLVPLTSFITILDRTFFPKWLQVLSKWLSSSPNYEEITKWYMGWKSLFNERLVQHPIVKAKLSQGLIMMNRSVSGGPNVDNINFTVKSSPISKAKQSYEPTSAGIQISSAANSAISSFKDIVEKKAAEHNLLFLPVANRFSKEGQQVYRFGNSNVYIEKNVIFMLQNGNWMPTSLSELVPKTY